MGNRSEAEILLADPALRNKLELRHPLIQQSEIYPTPPVKEFLVQVIDIIRAGDTGAWAVASPGIGKTSALLYLEAVLPGLLQGVMVIFWGMQDQQTVSIRSFHTRGLEAAHHNEFRGETQALRRRMMNKVIDDARIAHCSVVLIAIDEAQEMTTKDLRFMKSLYNDFQRAGLLVVCVLLGASPRMQQLMEKLQSKENADLMGRFGMHELTLRGYGSLDDVDSLLREIDRATFSEDLPIYLPQFFVARAWLQGWRLVHEAPALWAALETLAEGRADREIPARPLFSAVRRFLQRVSALDDSAVRWEAEIWKECLKGAQMEKALGVQNMNFPMTARGAMASVKFE